MRRWRAARTTLILSVSTLIGPPCLGQGLSAPRTEFPIRLGGLQVAPGLDFSSGIDTNVFNTPTRPTADYVWTLRPRTEAALKLGPARLDGRGVTEAVYFQRTSSERSVNVDGAVRLSVPLNHIQPYVAATFLRTRQRPSLAIDARSERHERSKSAGVTVRASARTSAELAYTRSHVAFDTDAVFLGSSLDEVLNRTTDTLRLAARHRLTPVTALVTSVERTNETFWISSVRNSTSTRVVPALEFGSSALVTGRAAVGYRRLDLKDASVPDFNGVVASTELTYTLRGATRVQLQLARDVEYSYEPEAPYYVWSRAGGIITRQVGDSVGVVARADRYRLGPRGAGPGTARTETLATWGGGVIGRFGRRLRLEVTVDYSRRTSPLPIRHYSGLRIGHSFVHEF